MINQYELRGVEGIVSSVTAGTQSNSRIVVLADGSFVVVWTDLSGIGGDTNSAIKAQRYDAQGNKVGSEFLVNTTTEGVQSASSLSPLSNGGFIVTWTDTSATSGDTAGAAIRAQMFDAHGVRIGSEFLVNTQTAGNQQSSSVTLLSNGNFVVSWQDFSLIGGDNSSSGIKAQLFDPTGVRIGGEFLVNSTIANTQSSPTIAAVAGGGFAVAWSGPVPRVQLFDSAGAKVGGEQTMIVGSPQGFTVPRMVALDNGFLVMWGEIATVNNPLGLELKGQLFDSNGQKKGGVFALHEPQSGDQLIGDAYSLPSGGFIHVWGGVGANGSPGLSGQLFDDNGVRVGAEFVISAGFNSLARIAVLPTGEIALTWTDGSSVGADGQTSADVKLQILIPSTAAPTDIALSNVNVSETTISNFSVGQLSATGALGATFTYEIVSDSTGGGFGVSGDQLIVADNRRLDFETAPTAHVRVRVTDRNGNSYEETLTINVADVAVETRYAAGQVFRTDSIATSGYPAAMVALEGGGFVVLNNRSLIGAPDNDTSRAQIFDAQGNRVGSEILLDASGTHLVASAAALPGGGFVVIFGAVGQIRGQRYDALGNEIGADFQVDSLSYHSGTEIDIVVLNSGGFVVTWGQSSLGGVTPDWPSEIHGQAFNAQAVKVGPEFVVNTTKAGSQKFPVMVALPDGGFAVFWTDHGATVTRGQFFDSLGVPTGGEFTLFPHTDYRYAATALDDGSIIVSWSELIDDSTDIGIYAIGYHRIDANGNISGPVLVDAIGSASYHAPISVQAVPGGGFVLTWTGLDPAATDPNDTISWGQFFTAAGERAGTQFVVHESPDGGEMEAKVAVLTSGDLVFAWAGAFLDNGVVNYGSFARLIRPSANEPTAGPGTPGNDNLIGTLGDDLIEGFGGDDVIRGFGGNDLLDGGTGADTMYGGIGDDIYIVDDAGDVVTELAGEGYDEVRTSVSGYVLPAHVEKLVYTGSGGVILGNAGHNNLVGGSGNDLFRLEDDGADAAFGGDGDDGFYFGGAMDGVDLVFGGSGNDQVALQGTYTGLTFNGLGLADVEMVVLMAGSDTRFANLGGALTSYNLTTVDANVAAGQVLTFQANTLRAGEHFTLNAAAETDGSILTFGGFGTETITGGQRDDGFYFGTGRFNAGDRVDGQGGSDQLGLQGDYAGANALTLGANQLAGIEFIVLMSGADARYGATAGQSFSYTLATHDGNVAAGQQMVVQANMLRVDEVLRFDGSAEADGSFRLFGGAAADLIIGGAQADELWGGAGDDRIEGGGGADTIRGGAGNDIFGYRAISDSTAGARDRIMDFAQGDLIDLSNLDGNASAAGVQEFQLIGSGSAFTAAGQLRITQNGTVALVEGDSNGDGVADFAIEVNLDGGHTLTRADFLGLAPAAEALKLDQPELEGIWLQPALPDRFHELHAAPSIDLVL